MKMSNFQIIVTGLCIGFVILGVGVFAAFGGLLGGSSVGPVTIWGTTDANTMENMLTTLRSSDKSFEAVRYVQKDSTTYQETLINAMASGSGPDLFFLEQDQVGSFIDKITPIPYSAVSQAEFVSSFIDEGQMFLSPQGILAMPYSIDPLIMYWNRDLFATAGLAQPPQYWNDFFTIAPKITSLDKGANVQKSAVALGTWKNVNHAKEILSTLFMQTGDYIVGRDQEGNLVSVFGQRPPTAQENPAESALNFYTEFANPTKITYSWNASLARSDNAFAAGDLAVYFGFASEYATLAARNPNLHFSVALMPQLKGNAVHLTFGKLTALALSRSSANPNGAIVIAEKLTSPKAVGMVVQATALPPVRRDVVLDTSSNAAVTIFARSSLIANAWLDPSPSKTDAIFKSMIESVISGAALPQGAVADAAQALQQLFFKPL